MESHLRVEIVPRPTPDGLSWTVPCNGSCGSTDPHDADLTPEAKDWLGQKRWNVRINGAELPIDAFAVQTDSEGAQTLSLVMSPASLAIGDPSTGATPPAADPAPKVSMWGDGSIPDPRESIPGWQPEKLAEQVAGHAQRVSLSTTTTGEAVAWLDRTAGESVTA